MTSIKLQGKELISFEDALRKYALCIPSPVIADQLLSRPSICTGHGLDRSVNTIGIPNEKALGRMKQSSFTVSASQEFS